MTKKSKTILFFGNERLISGLEHTDTPILNSLMSEGYNVVGVITHHHDATSRKKRQLEIIETAKKYNIPYFVSLTNPELKTIIDTLQPDAGILIAYGKIVPQSIIDLFPLGIINIHPSLLPLYRGPTPIESTLLNGDKKTGVSIMQLNAGMDEGPVYCQGEIPISTDESKLSLYKKVAASSQDLLMKNLDAILNKSLIPKQQKAGQATYSKLIQKNDGIIQPHETGGALIKKIKAYRGWPGSQIKILGMNIIVTEAHFLAQNIADKTPGSLIYSKEKQELGIVCADGILYFDTIKPAGKNEMPMKSFLNGAGRKLFINL